MNSFIINLVYLVTLLVGLPYLLYRIMATPGAGSSILPRLGKVPYRDSDRPLMMIHGVSVGEIMASRTLFAGLSEALPDWEFLITSTTPAGYEMARKTYPDVLVRYFPIDLSFAVNRFFRRLRPAAVILMELEIWPNFLARAYGKGIPVFLANGRISSGSYRNYLRFKKFLFNPFSKIRQYCVQTEEYLNRFRDLNVPESRIAVTGSMKFDTARRSISSVEAAEIRKSLGISPDQPILVAGSTHAGEEEILLRSFGGLKKRHPELLLILVPRYPERAGEISGLVRESGFSPVQKSALREGEQLEDRVLVVDTMGELGRIYGIASCVFVGGSLVPRGGQNMIEPAGLGRPVCFGPQIENFAEIGEMLVNSGAACYVRDARELEQKLDVLLSEPARAKEMGRTGEALVERLRGSTHRTVEIIRNVLNGKGE